MVQKQILKKLKITESDLRKIFNLKGKIFLFLLASDTVILIGETSSEEIEYRFTSKEFMNALDLEGELHKIKDKLKDKGFFSYTFWEYTIWYEQGGKK